jgi:hypothetical protein
MPGAIGRVVELHGAYYHAHWGFGAFFEAKVAGELAEFIGRYDEKRDGFWTATAGGRVEGPSPSTAARNGKGPTCAGSSCPTRSAGRASGAGSWTPRWISAA